MKNITIGLTALFFAVFTINANAQTIVINEILASNTVSIQDEDSSRQDWIELYNTGTSSINLLGFGLSDDPLLLYKWTFPNVSLGAGQYLIVWASDKNRSTAGSPLHTNFKISASGEALYLTNTSGVTINTVPPVSLQADISYGRFPNGTGPYVFFGTPTPNAVNATAGFSEALNPPVFSQASGFLTSGFNLTISSPDSGTTILYTLDGSEPDENNLSGTTYNYRNQYARNPGQAFGPFLFNTFQTLTYTAPIAVADRTPQPNKVSVISTTYDFTPPYFPNGPIYKGNVIRAKVIKPGALASKVVSKNYFITPAGPSKYSLPVLSFCFDENDLYDYEDGIAVAGIDFETWRLANPNSTPTRQWGNYERDGIENERKANMHYFVNGLEKINQDVGIRVRGAFSRVYPSKSWNIAARSDFGDDNLSYKFFSDETYTSYERLSAKTGGSDFYNTMIRDPLNHQLVKDLRMETESHQPMVVFMNGEYWGMLNMREKYDNNYFKQVYNIDDVDLIENQNAVQEGDIVDYNNMYSYISSNSFTSDANYAFIQTRMDTDNFIDYFTTNIFAQNDDWPGNNIVFWRKRTAGFVPNAPYGHDGRWRWAIHDMDSTLDEADHNSLADATATNGTSPNPPWSTLILRKLLENNTFKNDFINRFADLMNTNFLPARMIAKQNEMAAVIAPEMPDQYFRWKAPLNNGDWQYHLNEHVNFFNQRPAFQRAHIRSKFSISSNINATLNTSNYDHGYVKISTIGIKDGTPGITGNPYPWTGVYFSGIPLKLKAIAKPGFVFSNWTGASTSTNAEITITPTANFSITAVFVPDGIVDVSVPIYFWMMDGNIVNGAQLTSLNSTYELATNGVIQYQSCNTGYPTTNGGKSSMERRNNPTTINYRQAVNGNIPYASSDMRGLQIKQPFQSGGLENTMVFNFSTLGYKKIKFSFASVDEGAASAISVDYAVNAGAPVWITTGLASSSLPLTAAYQLFSVDFSTITSVDNNSNFKIRLRFTGPNMTADLGARVTFNNIAVDGVKIPLSYASPNIFNVGAAITNLVPSTTQVMTSYSVSPSLPSGLTLNTTSGVISGTPTVAAIASNYTVTGNYASGSETFSLNITVTDGAPTALSYASPNVFTKGTGIADLTPTSSGGAVITYSVSPVLPSGLSLDTTTGVVSGIPTAVTPIATYTVTATNSGGSTSFGIVITVKDVAPSALSYTSPNVFTRTVAIANLTPTSSGGSVVSYSISPALPSGLSFNTSTGVISGTPTAISSSTTYTVTATNTGGSATFGVVIRVNDLAPSALSYNSPNVFTRNVAIANLNPTVSGGTVTSYSISPALPSGLSFNISTGRISGTPTTISPTATYNVTANNTGGSTSFGVVITVNDVAPNSLSYNSPNVYTVGDAISNLNPSASGGTVVSYSISPALPSGLSFNTSTGVISGTPNAISATATYTVTAFNSGGSTSFGVEITVNDIAPSALTYNTPIVFTRGTTISSLSPMVSGGAILSYSISPALPSGLSFNTSTGVISGTPNAISATATYTVTAFNSGGSTSFGVVITVNDVAPNSLIYNSPNVYTVGDAISNLNPSASGGTVVSYSVSPALPSGLSFNTSTGVISGTPNAISATATYTVTANNTGGSTSFGVVITVNDIAPSALTYNTPNVFTRGTTISSLSPMVSGGAVLSYSISPALPAGLSFNTTTGVISGTPAAISATATYTVTAFNSGGSTSSDVEITINDIAPNTLSYESPNVFTLGSTISNLTPFIFGAVISYSISPELPLGLSFDTETGIISGTPTAISPTATYNVTANNTGGSTSFGVVITVNDVAPDSLSYNSPNVYTVGDAISNLNPSASGGTVVSYSVSPALPSGLSFNTSTGRISGTPNAINATATYTVTATNTGGSTSFGVVITVNDIAPSSLSYNSPNVYTVGDAISSLSPMVSGGAVLSYSISPALPSGLSFNTSTGRISGTPTAVTATSTYTVTATNTGGSTSFGVEITVNDIAPSSLSYNTPNVFTLGSTISDLTPFIFGTVISYSISPELPLGLLFDAATGIISGAPTIISATATYTVTAFNSGGSASFDVEITINDTAPSALSYNSPNVFTLNTNISNLIPTVSGGTVLSYSVSPELPLGLSFDSATGIISGTPTVISSAATYAVTAFNSGGSVSCDVEITVNDIAPSALSYDTPNVFTLNTNISDLIPTVSGGTVLSYSVSPELPLGLLFDTATGIISGTPTVISSAATYTVTAFNSGGSASFDMEITINDTAPSALSYNSPNVFTVNTSVSDLIPTVSGGTVLSYGVSPELPLGLLFDTATGIISGTPTNISATATYTVTAFNSGGSASFDMEITINDTAPSNLNYFTPNVFTIGDSVSLIPSYVGNVNVFTVEPDLPDGLVLNSLTGEISGIPTSIEPVAFYTITAENTGGSNSFTIEITIEDALSSVESQLEKIMVYPNPFIESIRISGVNLNTIYKVFAVDGKFIQDGVISNSDINLLQVPSGVYFLKITTEKTREKTFKIIKR